MRSQHVHPLPLAILPLLFGLPSPPGISAEKPPQPSAAKPLFHPKIFELIGGWISDTESPVVTEINLDAVAANPNQFDPAEVKQEDQWWRWNNPETRGFLRYRILESKGARYTIELQNNGGGTLTTRAILVVVLGKRTVLVDGQSREIRVLRMESFASR